MIVACDKCGREIEIILEDVTLEDMEIRYFTCSYCHGRYVVFAADAQMQDLVEQRKAVETQLRAAHTKRFTAKTIQGYIVKQGKIKAAQEAILPKLKRRAERLLREAEDAGGDV